MPRRSPTPTRAMRRRSRPLRRTLRLRRIIMRRSRRKIPATATAAIKTRVIKTRATKSKAIKAKAIETKAIETKAIKTKPIKTKPIKTKALKIAAITIKAMSSQREAASFPGRPASSTAFAKSRATACRISMTRRCRNCRRPATSLPMLPRRTRTAIELTSTTTPRTRPRLPITTIRKRATPAAGRLWLP